MLPPLGSSFVHGSGTESRVVTRVPISSLVPSDSPRLDGEDPAHVQALTELDQELPPILVHRPTMRVIDGMHRMRAAVLRGEDSIAVKFFDGAERDVFVRAVEANVTHGLPLSLRDRKAAAARIAREQPNWSDRVIARVAGLSPKTVAVIRRRSSEEIPQSNTRVGSDGRARPLDTSSGRAAAAQFISNCPDASLREIAKSTGISISTAHDVRQRMELGGEPVPAQQRNGVNTRVGADGGQIAGPAGKEPGWSQLGTALPALMNDPSLKLTQSGRALLRLMAAHAMSPDDWAQLADEVPSHWARIIGDLAAVYAKAWEDMAAVLRRRKA